MHRMQITISKSSCSPSLISATIHKLKPRTLNQRILSNKLQLKKSIYIEPESEQSLQYYGSQ